MARHRGQAPSVAELDEHSAASAHCASATPQVVEYRVQYDGAGADASLAPCQLTPENPAGSCNITFIVESDMRAPVYVYYELHNFYQNHRRYVQSRSDTQLDGTLYTDASGVPDCDPLRTAPDGRVLDPCGLVANSYFNGAQSTTMT
jgi:hypothetical protein